MDKIIDLLKNNSHLFVIIFVVFGLSSFKIFRETKDKKVRIRRLIYLVIGIVAAIITLLFM